MVVTLYVHSHSLDKKISVKMSGISRGNKRDNENFLLSRPES